MIRGITELPDDDITRALAKDRLGVPAVVFFVMSAAAPLTVVAGLVTTAYAVTGLNGIPVAFGIVGLALGLFSVGYVAMGRYLPHAGAFYAYIGHGLGKTVGVGAAWVALLAYNCLQIALYGGFGVAGAPVLEQYTGIELPWWVFALVAWALVSVLGVLRVDLNGTVLAVLLIAEVLIIAIFDFSFLAHPADGIDFSTLNPAVMFEPGAGALLAIAVLGFVGFESAVVFSEESRNPRRTIPLATFASVFLIATLYGFSSWVMGVTTGTDKIVDAAREEELGLIFGLAAEQLGPFFAEVGSMLFLTSLVAAMISFHNTISRYVFALGRERVLPEAFGATSASGAPRAGSLAQSTVALVVILVYAVLGLDPLVQLFYTLGTSGGFGALILITATAFAVVAFFLRNPHGEPTWRSRVLPALAVLAMVGMFLLATANFATMLGVPPDHPLRWGVLIVYILVGLFGTLYGVYLRSARPSVYAAIGMGAKSTSASMIAPAAPAAAEDPSPWFEAR